MTFSDSSMKSIKEDSFNKYRKNHVQLAKDLGYDKLYIEQIKTASTVNEITRILCTARQNKQ